MDDPQPVQGTDARELSSSARGLPIRTLADAHKDIEFGNSFRLEFIKHLIAISTGVFVFSVTFMKDLLEGQVPDTVGKAMLLIGWGSLVLSIYAGVLHMRYWAWFFTSWGLHPDDADAKSWRLKIDSRRRIAQRLQVGGFGLGIVMLFAFSSWNLLTNKVGAHPSAAASHWKPLDIPVRPETYPL